MTDTLNDEEITKFAKTEAMRFGWKASITDTAWDTFSTARVACFDTEDPSDTRPTLVDTLARSSLT